jgi:hypothetical protein
VPIQSSEVHTMIIVPCEHDVLNGKNSFCFRHSGNQSFRMLIAENLEAYKMAATKKLKMQIVLTIVDTVIFRGGRFLTQDIQGCWKDGGITLGKRKVGNAFRDAKRGRLRLNINRSTDVNVCAATHVRSPQVDGNNSFDFTNQQNDSNIELLPLAYHRSKRISQLYIQQPLTLESSIDWEKGISEGYRMNEYLDDYIIDEISRLWK